MSSGRILCGLGRWHKHFVTEMFSVPNRYKLCTNYMLSTRNILLSTSSTTRLSDMLHREDYKNNNNFEPHKGNNGKNNQEMCFNQSQKTQIGTKRYLVTEINFSKNDPDTFGNLQHTKETPLEAIEGDEGDREEEMYLSCVPTASQRLSNKQYAAMIKYFISKKKVFQSKDCHLIAYIIKICSLILIVLYVSAGRCY